MRRRIRWVGLMLLAVTGFAISAAAASDREISPSQNDREHSSLPEQDRPALLSGRHTPQDRRGEKGTADREASLEDVIQKASKSVCRITVFDKHGVPRRSGTGLLVETRRIVSCHHVFAGGASAKAEFVSGESIQVNAVVAVDRNHDLIVARLAKAPGGVEPLPLSPPKIPKLGQAVVTLGYPLSLSLTVSRGVISSLPTGADLNRSVGSDIWPENHRWIQTDAAVSRGNSGGPMLNARGEVIAVMALVYRGGENLAFGIPCVYLRRLMSQESTPIMLSEVRPSSIKHPFGEPILPVREQRVTFNEVSRYIGLIKRSTQCQRCRGHGYIEISIHKSTPPKWPYGGRDWYETRKERCPVCCGRGWMVSNNACLYEWVADLAGALVYLDTGAHMVTERQLQRLTKALHEVLARVDRRRVPKICVHKALRALGAADEEKPRPVCFVGDIFDVISAGNRDYFLADVAGAGDIVVVLICKANLYDWRGRYLIAGLAGGKFSAKSHQKGVYIWPALVGSDITVDRLGEVPPQWAK